MTEAPASAGSPRPLTGLFFWLALASFVALTVFLAMHHEMWRDEVRALSVAIHATSIPSLLDALRAEGHPAIWYLVLNAGYAIWPSTHVMPVAAILVSTIAVAVILRRSPFPMSVRLLLAFGGFLVVEETVMTRNYGIGIMFLVSAAALLPFRRARPMMPALMLALAANTSVHAALASLMLCFIWLLDLTDREGRRSLMSARGVGAFGIVTTGLILGFWTARPAPDMSFAFSPATMDAGRTLKAIFADPGRGLSGYRGANIAAATELPWEWVRIPADIGSRWVVNLCMLAAAWGLRKDWRHLLAFIVATAGFQVVFRTVYTGSLRHEGIVFFLFVVIGWVAIGDRKFSPAAVRRVTLGLLPLIAAQAVAMPFMARRILQHPESSSKAYGAAIAANPRYRTAILASDPDYLMESLPYYVPNAVYMPRQREFHYRVYFSSLGRRQVDLSLGELLRVTDSLASNKCRTVLLALGYPGLWKSESGMRPISYKPSVFRWDSTSRAALLSRGDPVFTFRGAYSDETYRVFEIQPGSGCRLPANGGEAAGG